MPSAEVGYWTRVRRAMAACALAALLALALAAPAGAEEEPPTVHTFGSGVLDWGVYGEFRNYIAQDFVHGGIEVSRRASRNEDGTIRFPVVGGTYNPDDKTGAIETEGTVRFYGHPVQGVPVLDATISDPVLDLGSGILRAHVGSRSESGGEPLCATVDFVEADVSALSPQPVSEPDGLDFGVLATELLETGEPVFGRYKPGTAFDPVQAVARFGTPGEVQQPLPDCPTTPLPPVVEQPVDPPLPPPGPPVPPPAPPTPRPAPVNKCNTKGMGNGAKCCRNKRGKLVACCKRGFAKKKVRGKVRCVKKQAKRGKGKTAERAAKKQVKR